MRDGIAATKGRVLRASGKDEIKALAAATMSGKERNTKLNRMMRDMRVTLNREDEKKEEMRQKRTRAMEVIDSESENERMGDRVDIFESRPNPLELT